MKEKLLLGVDIGTTNVKVLLVTADGRIAATEGKEITTLYPGADMIEQNAEHIWERFCEAVRAVTSALGIDPASIAGISVDSNRCGMILADEAFVPLTNNMTWQDCRADAEAKAFAAAHPEIDIYRTTGEDALPQYTLYKMIWVRKYWPEIWAKSRHVFFSPADYVNYQLIGRHVTCCGIAQSTHLFDINRLCYSEAILSAAEIDPAMLPELHQAVDVIGCVKPEIAADLGLPEGLRVISGACDATASQVGSGSMKPGLFTISIGTCSAMRTYAEKPVYAENKFSQIRVCAPFGYVPTCTVNDSGSVLKWFRNNFCRDLVRDAKEQNVDVYDLITREAEDVPPGCEGLLLLPNFTGGSYDVKDAETFGVYAGIRSFHTRGHFSRAILEGIAFSLRRVLDYFRQDGFDIRHILLCGGGAKSPLWCQIISDVLGVPVTTPECEEAAALGSAILVSVALGIYGDLDEAISHMTAAKTVYEPIAGNRDAYERNYTLFRELFDTLHSYYGRHAALTNTDRKEF